MAKFIYRMQSILNIKEKLEEQAKMEFAAARIRLDEEEARLEVIFVRKRGYEAEGRRIREDVLNIQELRDNQEALQRMDEYIASQRMQVMRAEKALEQARLKLQEAMQERKTYERLREKAFEEFMKEENARESKEIDELTSYIHGRKAIAAGLNMA